MTLGIEQLLFAVFSAGVLFAGLGVVMLRDPVRGALSLIVSFFCLASLYLLQSAELIAVLQVLVYAGAIMVLFVFVIMLVENKDEPIVRQGLLARIVTPVKVVSVAVVAVNLIAVIFHTTMTDGEPLPTGFGTARMVGREFFKSYLFQFELVSVLLLAAMVGAVMLSRPDRPASAEPEETKH